jgi:superfamily II DNA/RNA helicase
MWVAFKRNLCLYFFQKGDRGIGKTLVFVSTQEAVELLFTLLGQCLVASDYHMLSLARLHGDMPQQQRTEAFNKFSAAKAGVLICTVRHRIFYFLVFLSHC